MKSFVPNFATYFLYIYLYSCVFMLLLCLYDCCLLIVRQESCIYQLCLCICSLCIVFIRVVCGILIILRLNSGCIYIWIKLFFNICICLVLIYGIKLITFLG